MSAGSGSSPATDTEGVIYRSADSAPATWALGALFERLLRHQEAAGLDVAVVTQPAGTATPLHRHTREAEAFFMLDGALTYRAAEQTHDLSPGDFIFLPQGVPHAFRVLGHQPARFLGLVQPGGLFDLYDQVGRIATERVLPSIDPDLMQGDIAKWNELAPRFGIEVLGRAF